MLKYITQYPEYCILFLGVIIFVIAIMRSPEKLSTPYIPIANTLILKSPFSSQLRTLDSQLEGIYARIEYKFKIVLYLKTDMWSRYPINSKYYEVQKFDVSFYNNKNLILSRDANYYEILYFANRNEEVIFYPKEFIQIAVNDTLKELNILTIHSQKVI